MRGLIICPNCQQNQIKNVLGSVTEEGDFTVLRFRKSKTTIRSDSFQVYCDKCGELVFFREEPDESASNG